MNLVERLRKLAGGYPERFECYTEAADRIEELEAENKLAVGNAHVWANSHCELQAQVKALESALKEIIDTDYAEPVAPVAMKEIARAALAERNE